MHNIVVVGNSNLFKSRVSYLPGGRMWRNLACPRIFDGPTWGILLDAVNGAFVGKDSKWKRWRPVRLISSKTLIARLCIASAWKKLC